MIDRRRWAVMVVLGVLVTLAACAAKQPVAITFAGVKGYSEIWLDRRTIEVDFKGGMDEKVDKLKNLALLRAAELGWNRQFERFVIVKTTDQTIIDGVTRSGDQYFPVEKVKVTVIVKFVGKDDPEYPTAFGIEAKAAEIRKALQ